MRPEPLTFMWELGNADLSFGQSVCPLPDDKDIKLITRFPMFIICLACNSYEMTGLVNLATRKSRLSCYGMEDDCQ